MDELVNSIIKYYELEVKDYLPITSKTFKFYCIQDHCYFVKKINENVTSKYNFLSDQGVSNILFPIINKQRKFTTQYKNEDQDLHFYLTDYIENQPYLNEVQANNMFLALNNLHYTTSFPRKLSPSTTRAKFDEITQQLDYKFRVMEQYIRSLENQPLDDYSMLALSNYYIFLNAKKEMVKLQKRLIAVIKDQESINYVFNHNDPKLDHLLLNRGSKYLTSIDKGQFGLESLDFAKFYVENSDLNIDYKALFNDHFYKYEQTFYYDYFRYIILLIYIKRVQINGPKNLTTHNMAVASENLKKYFFNFSDKNEEVEQEYKTNEQ